MTLNIAVLSDIHGNLAALDAVLADVATQGCDVVVNLGDILSGPLQPAETADRLMALPHIVTIAGNHERQLLGVQDADPLSSDGYAALHTSAEHRAWLRSLPQTHWLRDDILLVHGTPHSDHTYWLESVDPVAPDGFRAATPDEVRERLGDVGAARLVLCGHTHVPRTVQCGGVCIANPGSVGLQAYTDDHVAPHRMQVGTPHARYAIAREVPGGGWRIEHRAVAYDWHPPAALAAQRGRPDWAEALATGRVAWPFG
jgi:putative phosphoesterase